MKRSTAAVALLFLGLAGCAGTTTSPTAPMAAHAFTFAAPTTPAQAPDGFGSEPSILRAHDGALYFTSVLGSASARGDGLWKTTDNGTGWTYLGKADYPFGGGDSDLDELAGGRLLLTGQWRPAAVPSNPVGSPYVTGGESVSYSTDGGKSWTNVPVAGTLPDADRNWIATYGARTAWLVYNFGAGGLQVVKTTNGGMTWSPPAEIPGTSDGPGNGANGIAGDAVADPKDGTLYIPYGPGPSGGTVQRLYRSTDGGATFTERKVHTTASDGTSGAIFSTVALDPAGGLYFAWAETSGKAMHAFVARSTDHGDTWGEPVDVTPPGQSIVFPWVVAAAPGRYAVSYLAANGSFKPDDAPAGTPWRPTVTFVQDGHLAFVPAAPPNHRGAICTGGTGCTSGRTLGDFFEMAADPWGRVALVYADDTGSAQANRVVVQATGSLLP